MGGLRDGERERESCVDIGFGFAVEIVKVKQRLFRCFRFSWRLCFL